MPRVVMAAIRTPDRTARPLLRKAASLAKAHRAQLHLVHVIDIPPDPLQSAGAEVRRAALSLLLDRRQALGKLAQRAELRAVRAISHVSWDYPASDGLVREALRRRPRLLVAESHPRGLHAGGAPQGERRGRPARHSTRERDRPRWRPLSQLPRMSKKYAAAVVAMGALSRRGLNRLFIGNTA
ncbi:MAG TPA: universal stress protein [Steroidobacter sp.]|nr:universal stress protein [Steroidobacter sp.]